MKRRQRTIDTVVLSTPLRGKLPILKKAVWGGPARRRRAASASGHRCRQARRLRARHLEMGDVGDSPSSPICHAEGGLLGFQPIHFI